MSNVLDGPGRFYVLMRTLGKGLPCVAGLLTAALASEAHADDYTPPKIYTVSPNGVNLSDGSFTFTQNDISIGPLALDRFHLGGLRDPVPPAFGPRMDSNFDIYIAQNLRPQTTPAILPRRYAPIVHIGNTSVGVYAQATAIGAPVSYGNQDAASGQLAAVGDSYVFTAQDGTVYRFSGTTIASITYSDNRIQTFIRSSGQLKEIVDSSGYALILDHNSDGTISAACGFNLSQTYVTTSSSCAGATLKTSYGYTSGHLTDFTDVLGQHSSYTWSGDTITCVKPPGYSTCKVANVYAASPYPWTVAKQTLADGAIWTYAIRGNTASPRAPDASTGDDPTNGATVTDPVGNVTQYGFSKSSPYSVADANGNTTSYRFTGGYENEWSAYSDIPPHLAEGTLLVEVDLPQGNKYLAEYYAPFNALSKQTWRAKPGSGLSDRVRQLGYYNDCTTAPATYQNCAKPIWIKDTNGNQTDYVYTAFGSVQSVLQAAPTSGAARPLKLYSYVQKYAYIQNGSGGLTQASSPIWLAALETDCQAVVGSNTATCDTSAPQTVVSYEYGADGTADNLLLRGKVATSAGVSLRTCFGYDHNGNRISQTAPRAGLTSCP